MSHKNIKFPCGICFKAVATNHRAVLCDVCGYWVHLKCNYLTNTQYNELIEDNSTSWVCLKCINSALPFSASNDTLFESTMQGLNVNDNDLEFIDFRLGTKEKEVISEISNLILENQNIETENTAHNCKYYDVEKFNQSKFKNDCYFSIIHHNIHSLQAHIDEFKLLLQCLHYSFDVIAFSESKLMKDSIPLVSIDWPNYSYEHTPTEATKGGTLIYISNNIDYKPRPDLNIYVSKQIESTFVELINPKSKNVIIGCIYKHHNVSEKEFVEHLIPVLKKINKENKPCQLCGDFNINLMRSVTYPDQAFFLDETTSLNFMPLITLPSRITSRSKTLIDNIFTNRYEKGIFSGN